MQARHVLVFYNEWNVIFLTLSAFEKTRAHLWNPKEKSLVMMSLLWSLVTDLVTRNVKTWMSGELLSCKNLVIKAMFVYFFSFFLVIFFYSFCTIVQGCVACYNSILNPYLRFFPGFCQLKNIINRLLLVPFRLIFLCCFNPCDHTYTI